MITNEVQLRTTRNQLRRLEGAIQNLEAKDLDGDRLREIELQAVRSQAEDLRQEIDGYEELRAGSVREFQADSLSALPEALIKARIARGWSQKELADRLGTAVQQVQRYESTSYASASLARLLDVVEALGISVSESVRLIDDAA